MVEVNEYVFPFFFWGGSLLACAMCPFATDCAPQTLAKKLGMVYFETSAKERINIEESFAELVRLVRSGSNPAKAATGDTKAAAKKKEKKPKAEGSGKKCILF